MCGIDVLKVQSQVECWSAGVLEYWSTGVLEYWSTGVLEYWSTGVLECWSAGVLECWSAGVLECCSRIGAATRGVQTASRRQHCSCWVFSSIYDSPSMH